MRKSRRIDERLTYSQVSQLVGVTRVALLTGYDVLGIPVAAAAHPAVKEEQITVHQGKSLRPDEAVIGAIMEALERHAAGRAVADMQSTAADLVARGEQVFEGAFPSTSTRIPAEWFVARCVSTGAKLWIRMERVAFPYYPPSGVRRLSRPTTTGLAAFCTVEGAVTRGLLEVLERNAVRLFLEGVPGARWLSLDTVNDAELRALLSRFERNGISLHIVDLSQLCYVPAFVVYAVEREGFLPNLPIGGQGAHFDARVALRSALLEVAQSRIASIQSSREDFARHGKVWNAPPESAERILSSIRRTVRSKVGWRELVSSRGRSIDKGSVLRELAGSGRRIAVCDLSRFAYGIPTVRVCIERMRDAVA